MIEYKTIVMPKQNTEQVKPIEQIATLMGIAKENIIHYGPYKAKIDIRSFDEEKIRQSKLILITSITPTKAGNGKTTTSIGLADGLTRIGKKAVLALREPSLGPCFGMKGGATGGGKSQLYPADDINLHFTGDFHAISVANNTMAALLDNYNFFVQGTPGEMKDISWRRVMDVNDRSLRYIITGLHGGKNGIPTETGFDITPASELIAIMCLSSNLDDLHERVDNIILGFKASGEALNAKDLNAAGAVTVLMKDAIKPNLVQTIEGTPAFVHGGPFANIAHGCNSIIATKSAMQYGDYVLTEAGFGSDLGAEKFFNIKCRVAGIVPSLSVLVITTQSLKLHGEVALAKIKEPNTAGLLKGMRNVERHVGILRSFAQKVLIVLNKFNNDMDEEVAAIKQWCAEQDIPFAINDAYARGGEGAEEAARMMVELTKDEPAPINHTYDMADDIETKIRKVAGRIYGASDVNFDKKAKQQLKKIKKMQLEHLPVCIAKTQYSFTDTPETLDMYGDFSITVEDLIVNTGAGFVVAVCGEMMRMPGLPEHPQAYHINLVNGEIIGLG
jgi:formate--tetrahydrofolate ligase